MSLETPNNQENEELLSSPIKKQVQSAVAAFTLAALSSQEVVAHEAHKSIEYAPSQDAQVEHYELSHVTKEKREKITQERLAEVRKKLNDDEKKDPFVIRAGRTVGHVSESVVKNTAKSVEGAIVGDIRQVVDIPKGIGEAVMGRDFEKHTSIRPTERAKKVGQVILDAGGVVGTVASSGVSIATSAAMGVATDTFTRTVVDHSPTAKKFKKMIEREVPGQKSDDEKKPFLKRIFPWK